MISGELIQKSTQTYNLLSFPKHITLSPCAINQNCGYQWNENSIFFCAHFGFNLYFVNTFLIWRRHPSTYNLAPSNCAINSKLIANETDAMKCAIYSHL